MSSRKGLAGLCKTYGAWLHVDGAFGLFAACDPARAHLLRGLDAADSIISDGHKWLNVPYDSGFVFTRHLTLHQQVFKVTSCTGYLKHPFRKKSPEERLSMPPLLADAGKTGYNRKVLVCAYTMAEHIHPSSRRRSSFCEPCSSLSQAADSSLRG